MSELIIFEENGKELLDTRTLREENTALKNLNKSLSVAKKRLSTQYIDLFCDRRSGYIYVRLRGTTSALEASGKTWILYVVFALDGTESPFRDLFHIIQYLMEKNPSFLEGLQSAPPLQKDDHNWSFVTSDLSYRMLEHLSETSGKLGVPDYINKKVYHKTFNRVSTEDIRLVLNTLDHRRTAELINYLYDSDYSGTIAVSPTEAELNKLPTWLDLVLFPEGKKALSPKDTESENVISTAVTEATDELADQYKSDLKEIVRTLAENDQIEPDKRLIELEKIKTTVTNRERQSNYRTDYGNDFADLFFEMRSSEHLGTGNKTEIENELTELVDEYRSELNKEVKQMYDYENISNSIDNIARLSCTPAAKYYALWMAEQIIEEKEVQAINDGQKLAQLYELKNVGSLKYNDKIEKIIKRINERWGEILGSDNLEGQIIDVWRESLCNQLDQGKEEQIDKFNDWITEISGEILNLEELDDRKKVKQDLETIRPVIAGEQSTSGVVSELHLQDTKRIITEWSWIVVGPLPDEEEGVVERARNRLIESIDGVIEGIVESEVNRLKRQAQNSLDNLKRKQKRRTWKIEQFQSIKTNLPNRPEEVQTGTTIDDIFYKINRSPILDRRQKIELLRDIRGVVESELATLRDELAGELSQDLKDEIDNILESMSDFTGSKHPNVANFDVEDIYDFLVNTQMYLDVDNDRNEYLIDEDEKLRQRSRIKNRWMEVDIHIEDGILTSEHKKSISSELLNHIDSQKEEALTKIQEIHREEIENAIDELIKSKTEPETKIKALLDIRELLKKIQKGNKTIVYESQNIPPDTKQTIVEITDKSYHNELDLNAIIDPLIRNNGYIDEWLKQVKQEYITWVVSSIESQIDSITTTYNEGDRRSYERVYRALTQIEEILEQGGQGNTFDTFEDEIIRDVNDQIMSAHKKDWLYNDSFEHIRKTTLSTVRQYKRKYDDLIHKGDESDDEISTIKIHPAMPDGIVKRTYPQIRPLIPKYALSIPMVVVIVMLAAVLTAGGFWFMGGTDGAEGSTEFNSDTIVIETDGSVLTVNGTTDENVDAAEIRLDVDNETTDRQTIAVRNGSFSTQFTNLSPNEYIVVASIGDNSVEIPVEIKRDEIEIDQFDIETSSSDIAQGEALEADFNNVMTTDEELIDESVEFEVQAVDGEALTNGTVDFSGGMATNVTILTSSETGQLPAGENQLTVDLAGSTETLSVMIEPTVADFNFELSEPITVGENLTATVTDTVDQTENPVDGEFTINIEPISGNVPEIQQVSLSEGNSEEFIILNETQTADLAPQEYPLKVTLDETTKEIFFEVNTPDKAADTN